MSTHRSFIQRWVARSGRAATLLVFAVGVTWLLLWLAGKFEPKLLAQVERTSKSEVRPLGAAVRARFVRVPTVETAAGTIRPVHETTIGARLLARVVEINLKAGQVVSEGDVLVRLDDMDLRARRS